ncbi:Inositol 2-dehydrogenase [Stratiformator vulcanicus]|uniref:Inositol 2-dehydrogenase n=2 Tax=Stratiformator vulcanicus TaxID=2527980 RepID=A0A517R7N6_9PLAN|nr:Inositol 2-dehydrogenase [Stratiformator vulcanicus]
MLKTTAAATAAAWWNPLASTGRAESPNEKLNIACIGIGGQGAANIRRVDGQNLIAFADVDKERAAKTLKKYPEVPLYSDYRKMFDQLEQQIDAVVVSTPDHAHFHPSMMAIERGMHLYCEKPLAHSVNEVRLLTEAAKAKGVATQLGTQRHNLSSMRRSVELVKSGAIGEVSDVHAWVSSSRGMPNYPAKTADVPKHLDWDLWLNRAAERPYSPKICPYNWRFWWNFGTGETGNWGCHILDTSFWALDLKYPKRVDVTDPDPHPYVTPKSMATTLTFPTDSGSDVRLHWSQVPSVPDAVVRQSGLSENDLKPHNTLFVGEKGMLACGFKGYQLLPAGDFTDFQEPESFIPKPRGFHQQWIDAARGGDPASCGFDYGGPLTEAVLLANVAFRAGGGFDWDAELMTASGTPAATDFLTSHCRDAWRI